MEKQKGLVAGLSSMQFTIVSGTNRPGNLSMKVAVLCQQLLAENGHVAELLDLSQLPRDIAFAYLDSAASEGFRPYQAIVDRSTHFIFVAPEYNGSIPGILKVFIDACDYPGSFKGKSAALVGIAAGSDGNRKGLNHLTEILGYFGMQVHSEKVSVAKIRQKLLDDGGFADPETERTLRAVLTAYCTSVKVH